MADIIAFGEPMFEFAAAEAGALADSKSFITGWGGDASNFAVSAARQGAKVGMMCRIGNDDWGGSFMKLWENEGISTENVIVENGAFTAVYFIASKKPGSHGFTYIRKDSAASHYSASDINAEAIKSAKLFHTSGITQAISPSSCDASFEAMRIAKQNGVLVSYDPNLRIKLWDIDRARAIINQSYSMADIVFPSLEDSQVLTGLQDPMDIAKEILSRGPSVVVLKLGGDGCLIMTKDEHFIVPPFKVDVVDTAGAGDSFAGAFTTAIIEGKSLREAATFGNAVASLTCTGLGCVNPIPRREVAEAHMNNNK